MVDVEIKGLLQEGFDFWDEIEHLKSEKVARGVDKGTQMSMEAVRPGFCLAGVQTEGVGVSAVVVMTEGVEVSTIVVMTDVTNVQVVPKTTYTSVASQASPEVVTGPTGGMLKWGGWGVSLLGLLQRRSGMWCLCLRLFGLRLCSFTGCIVGGV